MGIQLPAELAEVAAKAGLSWPQADEDAMRSSATAWREAGDQITRLASASDGSAGKALDALSGQTGDAARAHWNAIVSPDGDLGAAAKGCNAAADRLEHGADQVGAAKVELVRELVNLAKNNDAAHQAASAGHPTALLGLDTAVRGTSANVANLTNTLTNAVRLDSGVDMGSATPPVNANPGAHDAPPAPGAGHGGGGGGHGGGLLGGGLLGGVVDPVGAVVDTATAPVAAVVAPAVDDVVAPVVGTVTAPVAGVVEPVLGTVRDGLPGPAQDHGPDRGGPGPDHGQGPARDVIGIVDRTLEQQVAPAVQWPSETGSLPAGGPVTVGPVVDGVVAPAADVTTSASAATLLDRPMFPTEAPQAPTQQAPTTQAPAANVGSGQGFGGPPAAAAPGAVPPAAGGAAPAGSGGVVAGGSAQGGPQRGGEQAPQRAGQDQPAQKVEQKPEQKVDHKADQRGQQQAAVGKDALGKDPKKDESILPFAVVPIRVGGFGGDERLLAPGPIASVAPETPATPGVRPARTALPDDPATALFLLHMFPSRTLPAPSTEPAHQLPPPAADNDYAAGLRFEPQDHPDSALVEAGAEDRPLLVHGPGLGADHPKVLALSGGYDPQAGMHEREWDHRFLVRAEPPEYAWPPGELFPEGGYEEGQAGVLSEGVELDRFGTPEGRVLSELGTPFARRSLPPSLLAAGYHRYRVLRPLPVWLTLSAEWFGQAGSGVRYRTTYPVADLVALGYLMEISS